MCRMGKRRQTPPPPRQAAQLHARCVHGKAVGEQRSGKFYLFIQTRRCELHNRDLLD